MIKLVPTVQRSIRRGVLLPAAAVLVLVLAVASEAGATPPAQAVESDDTPPTRPTLTGRPMIRDAFHFQVAFGLGGGPDSAGVFHAMEIGGTFRNGWTLGLLHTFIQNRGVFSQRGGPDLFGGWMPQVKIPLYYDDLVLKLAYGPGGIHEQEGGIKAIWGLGWSYGLDFHVPFYKRSGLTLGTQLLHVFVRDKHHVGVSVSLGYTFF